MLSRKLILCLLVSSNLTACAVRTVPPEVAESVIDAVMADATRDPPWRLGTSWRDGGLGGAALRASALEHVVTQKEPPPLYHPEALSDTADRGVAVFPLSDGYGADEIERAWRKACRHGLDMTARERDIVAATDMPSWLRGQCYTASVYK
ncbi:MULTISPECIES: hypothetical protein [unclassified Methylocaldum]|jgi:hypothetical protein|uniref:hypothetical protein n=1 Tax=unclassified Methylocaldum TaxID=2622260 RepID=UPI0012EC989F|nr:hypothetical protein [Methylocaldum sp. RMAD-M]MBP1151320.1 hypothetical protein [Methylocaldum sp. RMAD-M]MVF24200.1 hypothetical protein [Methylocaldum sp. BRCS4]